MKKYKRLFIITAIMTISFCLLIVCYSIRNADKLPVDIGLIASQWVSVNINPIADKKGIEVNRELIAQVLNNLGTDKVSAIVKNFHVNMEVYIKGLSMPVPLVLYNNGWGTSLEKGDCFSYKDAELGERLYGAILKKVLDFQSKKN